MMSGAGKAMAPTLSRGGLATSTPSPTNPDITNPTLADRFTLGGKAIYVRTVTATIASPHTTEEREADAWMQQYQARNNRALSNDAITAYDAALVILDAVRRLSAGRREMNLRHADHPGDRTISVFQIRKDTNYAADDMVHQDHYIGVAPQS